MTGTGWHACAPYHDERHYRALVGSFVRDGLARDEPVLVAVPGGRPPVLDAAHGQVTVFDMAEAGRNPARLIGVFHKFVDEHGGGPARIVSEAVWPARSGPTLDEALRHEVLVDEALASVPVTILCPWQATMPASLAGTIVAVHSSSVEGERVVPSPHFVGSSAALALTDPLAAPPPTVDTFEFHLRDLAALRDIVRSHARAAGLSDERVEDLTLAAGEVATNTLLHAGPPGVLRLWSDDELGAAVVDFSDAGHIEDLLVGRRPPVPGGEHGWGLWIVNEICDLVQLRSGPDGTVIRLYQLRDAAARGGTASIRR